LRFNSMLKIVSSKMRGRSRKWRRLLRCMRGR
jgi:hypothetical protein